MTTEQIFKTANDGADFWRYNIGVNVIPADTKSKIKDPTKTKYSWKQWQDKPIPEEIHEQWKKDGAFEKLGIAAIMGKVWHNKSKLGLYLCAIDCDNKTAIDELSKEGLEKIARNTLTEQHKDSPNKCHIFFYTHKPVTAKSSDKNNTELAKKIDANEIPAFEVKGLGEHGIMFVSPSIHEKGERYEIIDCHTPMEFDHVEKVIDEICQKYEIPYLSIAQNGKALLPMSELTKADFVIHEGHNRHEAIMRYMESKRIKNPEFSDDMILQLAKDFNKEHCDPPLADNDPVWTREFNSAKEFSLPIIQKNLEDKEFLPIPKIDREKQIDIQAIDLVIESGLKSKGKDLKNNYRRLFVKEYEENTASSEADIFEAVKSKAAETFASKNPLDDESIQEIQYTVRQKDIEKMVDSITPINASDDDRSKRLMVFELLERKILKVVKSKENPDQVIVLVEVNGRKYYLDVSDSYLLKLVRTWAQEYYGEVFTDADYESGIKQYYARQAIQCENVSKVYLRFCYDKKEHCIYYDPSRRDCKIIKITAEGFGYIEYDEEKNPTFIKNPNTWISSGQVDYKLGVEDPLEKFVTLFHIADVDKLLFKSHLITLFLSDIPFPIMMLNGEQGTAKTTLAKMVKYISDPDRILTVAMPEDNKDLGVTLSKRALNVFDNISGMRKDQSDIFCRSVTGAGIPSRTLFTNNDETINFIMTKSIMNGISSVIGEPDLLQRSIIYELAVIPDNDRKTDDEVLGLIEELRPQLLGQIFTILSKTLRDFESVSKTVKEKPRMASFALWGETIARCLGGKKDEFLDRYNAKQMQAEIEIQDRYPLLGEIIGIVDAKGEIKDTMQGLYEMLKTRITDTKERERILPKTVELLGKQVKKLATTIRKLGYDINFIQQSTMTPDLKKGARIVTIKRVGGI